MRSKSRTRDGGDSGEMSWLTIFGIIVAVLVVAAVVTLLVITLVFTVDTNKDVNKLKKQHKNEPVPSLAALETARTRSSAPTPSSAPLSGAAAARKAARDAIAAFKAGVASGAVEPPSEQELYRLIKTAGDALLPEYRSNYGAELYLDAAARSQIVSYNRQVAESLGLSYRCVYHGE